MHMKTPATLATKRHAAHSHIVYLCFCLLLVLAGCSQTPDEEQIKQHIEKMQAALENRDTGELMSVLHPDFMAREKMDREQLKALVTLQFIRHQKINVMLLSLDTTIDQHYDYRAQSRGTAIITGASQLLPDDGRIYHFSLDWRKSGDDWLLRQIDWE